MHKTLLILAGPPGSGKTIYAKDLALNGLFTRISQDDLGKDGHLELFKKALSEDKNIVIDRMNFNKEQRDRYITPAKELGYLIDIVVFFIPYEICLARCLERISHPTIKTKENAESALKAFFTKFERPTLDECGSLSFKYWKSPKTKRKSCVIIDLDGTFCNIDHRLHFVQTSEKKKDWKSFFEGIPNDEPNQWCVDIINGLTQTADHRIIYCSGRPSNYRKQTNDWLKQHSPAEYYGLYMRPDGDYRNDTVVKENLLDFEILTRYNVQFALDDRPSVCRMWRDRGITTLQCQDKEF